MKKYCLLAIALITSLLVNAQKSVISIENDTREYTLLQVGYASEFVYDGLFVECIKSRPIYRGLSLEYGLRGQWEMFSFDDLAEDMFGDEYGESFDDFYEDFQNENETSAHYVDIRAKVGVSYPFKLTEQFSMIPHAGLQLGAKIGCNQGVGSAYAMGMDLGLRGRYKKFFVSYAYTIAFTGMAGTHSVGLGIAL